MKKSSSRVPNAVREVREWKQAIHDEVKHLPLDQALFEIARAAHGAAVEYGFADERPHKTPARVAADVHGEYHVRKKGNRSSAGGHGHDAT